MDSLVEGVLGAFVDVSTKLSDLKHVTDSIGRSSVGLQSVVSKL